MLKLFRKKKLAVRILMFGVVGLVGLMMVVTLVPGFGGVDASLRDPAGMLARIDDRPISPAELNREVQRRLQQFQQRSDFLRQLVRETTLEDTLSQWALVYEAGRLGLTAGPDEVAERLRRDTFFFPGGQFIGQESYRRFVQQIYQMSVPEFEDMLRRQLLAAKLESWVMAGVTISPADIDEEYRRRNERVQIEYAVLRPADVARTLQPSEDDLRAFYESNRERYQLPEKRSVRFVPIDFEVLKGRLVIPAADVEAYYRSQQQSYRLPERVQARHILFRQAEDARAKAEQVLAQLKKGGRFAALAREHSEDPLTREQGGEIGWVQRGQAVGALEEVLFSRPPGAVELVEASYGFHIVQVLAREEARLRPLEEVRAEIVGLLREQRVQQAALDQAQEIVEKVRGGATLDDAASEFGWPVFESPLVARNEPMAIFGNDPAFQDAAFALPADSAGSPQAPLSEPISLPQGDAVMRLNELRPAHQGTFEEVRPQAEEAYRQERGGALARTQAQQLAAEAQAAGQLRGPARKLRLEAKTSEKFGRQGVVPDIGSVRDIAASAFTLPVGGTGPALQSAGNWVVFRVVAHDQADLSQL
ncbi:MAG: peptidyl-prolyl cis-trans isomerase, partial [Terriglobia bacterium]